ncbi:hypothetical protein CERZMDRAFT_96204 [Cercospora zeae-maydis SCOH1-5]|uniref:Uncharacterized protein n=1 Tax=Cercospora zeae-maydis SCOH1-5 TaxID=717836 RepID=A0A6A6FIW6_9PEZI|nr:hypothetical protein CERZMDRAFT_96204 [Cercospora zeae-maydis SCOH1-5]
MVDMEATAQLRREKKLESKIIADNRKEGKKQRYNGSKTLKPAKSKSDIGQAPTNRIRIILNWLIPIFAGIAAFMLTFLFGPRILQYMLQLVTDVRLIAYFCIGAVVVIWLRDFKRQDPCWCYCFFESYKKMSNADTTSPRSNLPSEAPWDLEDYEAASARYQEIIKSKVESFANNVVAEKLAQELPPFDEWEVHQTVIRSRACIAFGGAVGPKLAGFIWKCLKILEQCIIVITALYFGPLLFYVALLNGNMPWDATATVKSHLRALQPLSCKIFNSQGKLIKPRVLQSLSIESIEKIKAVALLLMVMVVVNWVFFWAWHVAPGVESVDLRCIPDTATGLATCEVV